MNVYDINNEFEVLFLGIADLLDLKNAIRHSPEEFSNEIKEMLEKVFEIRSSYDNIFLNTFDFLQQSKNKYVKLTEYTYYLSKSTSYTPFIYSTDVGYFSIKLSDSRILYRKGVSMRSITESYCIIKIDKDGRLVKAYVSGIKYKNSSMLSIYESIFRDDNSDDDLDIYDESEEEDSNIGRVPAIINVKYTSGSGYFVKKRDELFKKACTSVLCKIPIEKNIVEISKKNWDNSIRVTFLYDIKK